MRILGVVTGRRTGKRVSRLALIEALNGYAFVSLTVIGLLVFTLGPVLASLYLSGTKWDLFSTPRWVGLDNFRKLFKDEHFLIGLGNTLYYAIGTVPTSTVLALFLAMLLNQKLITGRNVFRTIFFLPNITPTVAMGVVWAWLYAPQYGLFDVIFKAVGLPTVPWLTSTRWAMPSVMIMSVWQSVGYNMVIFLAGLQSIPEEYHEAAQIDGAGWWRRFRHITIPLLSPSTFLVVIMSLIGSLQVFSAVYIMTRGGPGTSTLTMVYYLYRNAFEYFRMGYASAMAYVLFIILLILTVVQFRLQRYWVHYQV